MTENFSLLLLLTLAPFVSGSLLPFEDCGSQYYLESIEVSGCTSYPCHLSIGSSVQVTANLLIQGTAFDSEKFVQNVYFVVSSVFMEVGVTPEPCKAVKGLPNDSCSLRNGDRIQYQAILAVQNLPPLPAKLYWSIRDQTTGKQLVCYKMTVILKN